MERLVDPQGSKRSIGEFDGGKPQILALRGTQQEKAQSRTAGNEIDEQQNIGGKEGPESTPDLEGLPLAKKSGVADADGCLGSCSQGVGWRLRIDPNADGDRELTARGGRTVGQGYELLTSDRKAKCQPVIRRHSAQLANQSATGEDLVVPVDYGNEQRQGRVMRGHDDLKPVPCEAAITGVALRIPGSVRTDQWPLGVVEVGVRPAWVVAGMEAPEVMDFDHGGAFALKVHDLGPRTPETCDSKQNSRNA